MKSIFLLIIAVAIAVCNSYAATEQAEQQVEQHIKIQQERLEDIEEVVLAERQSIEDWYVHRLAEIERLAEQRARELEEIERILWPEFINAIEQVPSADTYLLTSGRRFVLNTEAFELSKAMIDSYFLGATRDLLIDSDVYSLLAYIEESENQNPLIRKASRKLLDIMEEFQMELSRLQNQRKIFLDDLEQWKKDQKDNVFVTIRYIEAKEKTVQRGVIYAISYGRKEILAMVDGEIVHQGSVINGVKVVKIHKNKIEFAKNRKRWEQKITDEPAEFWQ